MIRGPLANHEYKPQFSGHETFPLRYGWLKKAFDAVENASGDNRERSVFSSDDAIARFGVGKNMVASMRYWATASGVLCDAERGFEPTKLGRLIFGKDGVDPYMEHPSTLWLIHWFLAGHPEKTTCFWTFNHFPASTFERDHLVRGLRDLAQEREWLRAAVGTIKRDVECFARVYSARRATARTSHEDELESPLTELGLIRPIGRQDGFQLVRGRKPTLGGGVFMFALIDFWNRHSNARTLAFEAIAHEPGSPGRVFLLDEDDLFGRLQDLEDFSAGALHWSETAGLKQVIRERDIGLDEVLDVTKSDYRTVKAKV